MQGVPFRGNRWAVSAEGKGSRLRPGCGDASRSRHSWQMRRLQELAHPIISGELCSEAAPIWRGKMLAWLRIPPIELPAASSGAQRTRLRPSGKPRFETGSRPLTRLTS